MASASWKRLQPFPTTYLQTLPTWIAHENVIIYTTDYYNLGNMDNRGICEYDLAEDEHKIITLWSSKQLYPCGSAGVYSPMKNQIIFVGGEATGEAFHTTREKYKQIMIYDRTQATFTKLNFETIIGTQPVLALTNNDEHLHIIGGSNNCNHILYNLSTNTSETIHSFGANPAMCGHALIHHKETNTLIMLGGCSDTTGAYYDTFWALNLNNHSWVNNKKRKLPKKMKGFGYVLYDDRIIITFGGASREGAVNNIYYIDLFGDDNWKESKIKCPRGEQCQAVLINNDLVEIVPWIGAHPTHSSIKIAELLPPSLISKTKALLGSNDVVCKEQTEEKTNPNTTNENVVVKDHSLNEQQLLSVTSTMDIMSEQIKNIFDALKQDKIRNDQRMEKIEQEMSTLSNKILAIERQKDDAHNVVSNQERLRIWLDETVNLPQYLDLLINDGYDDLETVADVTSEELIQMGISKTGHRKKLIKYAQKLKQPLPQHTNQYKQNVDNFHIRSAIDEIEGPSVFDTAK
eukprot:781054_1